MGAQHHQNMTAAQNAAKIGVSVEVINLRTLNPLDINTITESVRKTGRCIIAHEAPLTQGFGAEITAQIQEKCFLNLKAPVKRCCGFDTPFPNTLESYYLPDAPRIEQAIIEILEY